MGQGLRRLVMGARGDERFDSSHGVRSRLDTVQIDVEGCRGLLPCGDSCLSTDRELGARHG